MQYEEISGYSPQARTYEYAIDGGLPVRDNRGSFAVEPSAAGACVVWRSSFEALDPEGLYPGHLTFSVRGARRQL